MFFCYYGEYDIEYKSGVSGKVNWNKENEVICEKLVNKIILVVKVNEVDIIWFWKWME